MRMPDYRSQQFADFCAFLQAEGRSADTCRHYTTYLNQFGRWLEANGIEAEKPSHQDGRAFLVDLSQHRGYRTQTYNQAYYSVRGFLRWLHADPTLGIGLKPRPAKARARRYLDHDGALRLLAAVDHLGHRCVLELQFATGLRLSESLSVRLTDIEGGSAMLVVPHGKGGHGRRIPLAPTILDHLRAHWRRFRPTDWLFPSAQQPGRPISKTTIQAAFRAASQKTGQGLGQSTHLLRHSFALLQLMGGMDVRNLQQILGHQDLGTTLIYLQDLDLQGSIRPRIADLLVRDATGAAS